MVVRFEAITYPADAISALLKSNRKAAPTVIDGQACVAPNDIFGAYAAIFPKNECLLVVERLNTHPAWS
jgi:hypothetical protein